MKKGKEERTKTSSSYDNAPPLTETFFFVMMVVLLVSTDRRLCVQFARALSVSQVIGVGPRPRLVKRLRSLHRLKTIFLGSSDAHLDTLPLAVLSSTVALPCLDHFSCKTCCN